MRRADQRLGNIHVDPALRTLAGPAGIATLEPRMMQVFLALADAGGQVVTRDTLITECWDGQIVGDDSINRAVSGVRKAGRDVGADFRIETVSKAGYRLSLPAPAPLPEDSAPRPIDRRMALVAGLFSLAGVGLWAGLRARRAPEVSALLERGRTALREELPDSAEQGIGMLREATRRAPDDAEAWGLLALALCNAAEYAPAGRIAAMVRDCERAAARALDLDREQIEARTALVLIRPTFGDWLGSERRMRALLADAPDTAMVWSALAMLMQSVGRCAEAVRCSERAVALDPLSPVFQYRLAYQLSAVGRPAEADRQIDRSLQLWPRHPAVWYARLWLFGLSGRPRPALAMLDDPEGPPPALPPRGLALWRTTLSALDRGGPVDAARDTVLRSAAAGSGAAVNAILLLSALGAVEEALDTAEGYLLRRGPWVGSLGAASGQLEVNDQRWRKTMMLFAAPTANLRAHGRFAGLVRDMGLTTYWRAAGITPDYLRRR